jgi:tRNA(Ile2)-agmatinylcytidine synthase
VFLSPEKAGECRDELAAFFTETVRHVITIDRAREIIARNGIRAKGYKNGRGLIGALAACGAVLAGEWDHTYEMLAYRKPENWGTPRHVDEHSVWEVDSATYPLTWDNVDVGNDMVVCVPHSVDPVLFGIRGSSPEAIRKAVSLITGEKPERYALYRTNQGTDMHLIPASAVRELEDMHSYVIEATVAEAPHTIRGGHSFFSITDLSGAGMECAAFEPTKQFRELIRKLIPGDRVRLSGSVKDRTLNIEKLEVMELEKLCRPENPTCPSCGKKMKSAGTDQGYRCRDCRTTAAGPGFVEIKRDIETGIYEVPPCARRHLSMPLIRLGKKEGVHPSR